MLTALEVRNAKARIKPYKLALLTVYSGEVGHAFQSKPGGHSGGSRPPIPVIPATLVGA
jgi:hypothetical protein